MGASAFGQTVVTLGGGASITCPTTPTATYTTPPAGVSFSNWSRGSGVTCASAADGLSGSVFSTTTFGAGFTANKFYKITITADATHTFTLSSITWLTAISSGTATFTIEYSNNGGAVTAFGTTAQTGTTTNTFTGSVVVAAGTSIDVYFIPVTSATGTIRLKNGSTFTVTAAAASNTDYYLAAGADPTVTTNWGTVTNGTGSNPSAMNIASANWHVTQNGSTSASAWANTWTLGSGSAILANGGNTFNVTNTLDIGTSQVSQENSGTATISVGSTGTIRTSNANGFSGTTTTAIKSTSTTVTLNGSSTVEYYGTSAQAVTTATTYANVKFSGSGGSYSIATTGTFTLASGTLTVSNGTLVLNTSATLVSTIAVGSVSLTGGTLDGCNSALTGTATILQVSSAWNQTAGFATTTGAGVTKLQFVGGGATTYTGLTSASAPGFDFWYFQVSSNTTLTLTANSAANGVSGADLTIDAGSTLDASTFTFLVGASASSASISGTFKTANLNGFSGGVATAILTTNTPTVTLNSGSTVNYTAASGTQTVTARADYQNLTISGGSAKTLAGASTAAGTLTLTSGILTTTTTNTLTLSNTLTTAVSGGSTTSFINGPLNWTLPASLSSSSSVYGFPVGAGSTYLPLSLTTITTGATGPLLQVQGNASNAGGTADGTTVSSLSGSEFWSNKIVSGNFTDGSISLTRQSPVSPFTLIAKSTTQAGSYSSIGGTASGNSINNSSGSGAISAGNSQFYVFGAFTSTPTIAVSGTLSAVNTVYGTASASPTSFTISGSNLTANISVVPPAGFEVSTTVGSGYTTNLTLTQSGGTVGATTVFVRLAATTSVGSYSGNIACSSAGAATQNVATALSTVSQKPLTITGLTGADKIYDRATSASFTGTAALSGVVPADNSNVTLGGSPTATFADFNVGTNKAITVSGYTLSGTASGNYSLTQPTGLTANITAKALTTTGATAQDKVYDTTTTATITGETLVGVISPDVVTVSGGGTFADANVGTNKAVTATLALGGANASNYSLTQPTGLTANITKANQTITFGALPPKYTSDAPFALTATASSALAVSYTSSNPSVATVSGSTVTIVAVGTTTITASQPGDGNYNAATDVPQTLTVQNLIAGWDVSTQTGGTGNFGTSPLTVTTKDANVTVGGLTRGSGVTQSGSGAGSAWGGTGFTAASESAAVTANTFATFTVKANTSFTVSLTAINPYNIRRSSTGPTTGIWQYSTDGSTFTDIGSAITWGAITSGAGNPEAAIDLSGITALQNLPSSTTVTFRIVSWSGAAAGSWYINNLATAGNDLVVVGTVTGVPTITTAGTLGTTFATTYGTASSSQSFTASGANLTNDILVTAPTGYEVSQTAGGGSGYASTQTLTQSGGTVANTTIYVRLSSTAPVGTGSSNVALTSTGATTQNVAATTGTITPKALTISSPAAADKVYDRTNAAVITGTLSGIVNGDSVTLNGTGTFAQVTVGTGIAVTSTSTLSGTGSGNYSLTQPTGLTANITQKPLTTIGATAQDKVYDGNNTAIITGESLVGVIAPDNVTVGGGGTFADANAGANKPVTAALTLGGADFSNYSLTQPIGLTASINKANQTINFTLQSSVAKSAGILSLTATATSGLTVSYASSDTAIATVSGSTLNLLKAGTITVTASQPGDSNYNAATDVVHTLHITGFTAGNDTVTRPAGSASFKILKSALLANDGTVDGTGATDNTGVTITGVSSGSGNTVSESGPFVFYIPDSPAANAPLTFTYTATDGSSTDTGTVTVLTASAQPFTLAFAEIGMATFSGGQTSITIGFISVPAQSLSLEYSSPDMSSWTTSGVPNPISTGNGAFQVTISLAGDHTTDWNSAMFFRATRQ